MKASEMLHPMCQAVLAATDIKALCKAREFPRQAASSRGVLETLFLSPQGLSQVFEGLESKEIAALHLLKSAKSPVNIEFFSRIYGGHSYGTYNQRFSNCFAKVKNRLIRNGVILWAEARQAPWEKSSKLERWRFAFPSEFQSHLPPLVRSTRQLEGEGNWRPNVARDKLIADLSSGAKTNGEAVFRIESGELWAGEKPFSTAELACWQLSGWRRAFPGKKSGRADPGSQPPHEGALSVLSELAPGHWAAAPHLTEPVSVFCGKKLDTDALCQAGWEWGLLAKRRKDDCNWYRPVPDPPPPAPHQYLTAADRDGCVAVDLTSIPFDVLQQLVAISNQRAGDRPGTLWLTPNLIKLGRASDELMASEAVQWLVENTRAFAEAHVQLNERRGKTILHENLHIARISDLSLKVAIEKALGKKLVSLKNDFVAFPRGDLDEVLRVVKKSGHVVKEVAAK